MLTGNSIIKCLFGQVTCLVWGVQDLVVEDGEVEGEAETDWVGWCEVGLGNFGSVLIGLKGLIGRLLALITNGELSKVAVIVTLPVGKF
jgi:hypothetical protein